MCCVVLQTSCEICSSPRPPPAGQQKWVCHICTFLNVPGASKCEVQCSAVQYNMIRYSAVQYVQSEAAGWAALAASIGVVIPVICHPSCGLHVMSSIVWTSWKTHAVWSTWRFVCLIPLISWISLGLFSNSVPDLYYSQAIGSSPVGSSGSSCAPI